MATHHFIRRYILKLGNIEQKLKPTQTVQNRILVKEPWVRPPQGICKFNVDGAVSKRGNRGTTTVVCRDDQGIYMGSQSITFPELYLLGIKFTFSFNFRNSLAIKLSSFEVHKLAGP